MRAFSSGQLLDASLRQQAAVPAGQRGNCRSQERKCSARGKEHLKEVAEVLVVPKPHYSRLAACAAPPNKPVHLWLQRCLD